MEERPWKLVVKDHIHLTPSVTSPPTILCLTGSNATQWRVYFRASNLKNQRFSSLYVLWLGLAQNVVVQVVLKPGSGFRLYGGRVLRTRANRKNIKNYSRARMTPFIKAATHFVELWPRVATLCIDIPWDDQMKRRPC